MTTTRKAACAALIAAVALACGSAQITLGAQSKSFAWKVTGGQGSLYLVGSVHLLSKDFYPLNPVLENAYKDSDILVEEVDISEMTGTGAQLSMLTRGMQP